MIDILRELTNLPWCWEWVPRTERGGEVRAAWTEHMVDLFEDWTAEGLAAARLAWPSEEAGIEFPFTSDMVGRGAAEWLLERADGLPSWARLAWGVAYLDKRPRWAPIPVVVQFRRPTAEDPAYLMDFVGANGWTSDARPPVVDYVTTPIGDGLRVFALARSADGAAFGRVDAAMRLDVPPSGGAGGVSVDVLLHGVAFEMSLMAVLGPGVEQLMQLVAAECAPSFDGAPASHTFATTSAEGPS